MTIWTPEKDDEFRRMRMQRTPVGVMASHFDTTVGAVYAHARLIKALVMERREWTAAEVETLLRLDDEGQPIRDIGRVMGRPENSVKWKLDDLGREAKRMRYWHADDDSLRAMAAAGDAPETMADRLGRPLRNVRQRLRKLGLSGRRKWSEAEVERLRAMVAAGDSAERVAGELGREVGQVTAKAYALKLRFSAPPRVLTGDEVARLRDRLGAKDAVALFAREIGVEVRWLRDNARRAGLDLGRTRRPNMDAAARDEVIAAARNGMTVSEAVRVFGRDVRTLNGLARGEGIAFARAPRVIGEKAREALRARNAVLAAARAEDREAARRLRLAEKGRRARAAEAGRQDALRDAERRRAEYARPARPTRGAPPLERAEPVGRGSVRRAAPPPVDRRATEDAVARFLATRQVTREVLDPVEEAVRALRRRGFSVTRDERAFLVDGRTRLANPAELAEFARVRRIEVPSTLGAAM